MIQLNERRGKCRVVEEGEEHQKILPLNDKRKKIEGCGRGEKRTPKGNTTA